MAVRPGAPPTRPLMPDPQNIRDQVTREYLHTLNGAVSHELDKKLDKDAPNVLFIMSPLGKVFQVKVDEAGVLSTTLVLG